MLASSIPSICPRIAPLGVPGRACMRRSIRSSPNRSRSSRALIWLSIVRPPDGAAGSVAWSSNRRCASATRDSHLVIFDYRERRLAIDGRHPTDRTVCIVKFALRIVSRNGIVAERNRRQFGLHLAVLAGVRADIEHAVDLIMINHSAQNDPQRRYSNRRAERCRSRYYRASGKPDFS